MESKLTAMNKHLALIIFRRLITSLLVLFLLISLVFIIVRLSPGDPAQKFLSPDLDQKLYKEISESYQLNEPIIAQYFAFLKNIVCGELGVSYSYRVSVSSVIADYLPFTILFSMISFLFQIAISLLLVIISLKKPDGFVDRILSTGSNVVYAVPVFLSSVFLIYLFSYQLDIFSSSGLRSFNFDSLTFAGKVLDYAKHLTLPFVAISLTGVPIYYKYLRDSIYGNMKSNYVINLKAFGLERGKILRNHVLPNSVNSVIAVAGIELGILLGGALIVETIFSLPGMGQLTMNAVLARDYPLIIGCSLIAGIMIIVTTFLADILRVIFDKRLIKDLLT